MRYFRRVACLAQLLRPQPPHRGIGGGGHAVLLMLEALIVIKKCRETCCFGFSFSQNNCPLSIWELPIRALNLWVQTTARKGEWADIYRVQLDRCNTLFTYVGKLPGARQGRMN